MIPASPGRMHLGGDKSALSAHPEASLRAESALWMAAATDLGRLSGVRGPEDPDLRAAAAAIVHSTGTCLRNRAFDPDLRISSGSASLHPPPASPPSMCLRQGKSPPSVPLRPNPRPSLAPTQLPWAEIGQIGSAGSAIRLGGSAPAPAEAHSPWTSPAQRTLDPDLPLRTLDIRGPHDPR